MDTIVVNNISKNYNIYKSSADKLKESFSLSHRVLHTEFHALSDISFRVGKGEILGIMGRNGAGKSTLLKIITGIVEPSSGEVSVKGRISSLLELGTGFNMEYTGIENIYFYGTLMGFSKKQVDEKVNEIISFAEIGDYINQVVKTYSSGMFARLAFSCAINVEPDILIVDEILSVGDMRFQAKCFKKFKEFREKGTTILYVGHDVGMMRTFCDRCIWIDKGRIVLSGDPTYVSAKYTEFMYLDEPEDAQKEKEVLTATQEHDEPVEEQKPGQTETTEQEETNKKVIIPGSRFTDAIAHWGTHVGLIKDVTLLDETGERKNHFSPHENMTVKVSFAGSESLNYKYLSVAVSIKNKEGTDLIVKTTYDENVFIQEKAKGAATVSFTFKPMLSNGEYYLVVAMENRENMNPTYYEYIEGVRYFKIFSDKKIFGYFDVEARIDVE